MTVDVENVKEMHCLDSLSKLMGELADRINSMVWATTTLLWATSVKVISIADLVQNGRLDLALDVGLNSVI